MMTCQIRVKMKTLQNRLRADTLDINIIAGSGSVKTSDREG